MHSKTGVFILLMLVSHLNFAMLVTYLVKLRDSKGHSTLISVVLAGFRGSVIKLADEVKPSKGLLNNFLTVAMATIITSKIGDVENLVEIIVANVKLMDGHDAKNGNLPIKQDLVSPVREEDFILVSYS